MTAHPKIDPATGRMHSFGYGFTEPFLEYRVHAPDGTLLSNESVALPRSVMMHDFAITSRRGPHGPARAVRHGGRRQMVSDPASGALPFRWDPAAGARLGVLPLGGPTGAVRWVEIEPCYVYHTINAVRHGGGGARRVPAGLHLRPGRAWPAPPPDTAGRSARRAPTSVHRRRRRRPGRRPAHHRRPHAGHHVAARVAGGADVPPGRVAFSGCQHIDMATGELDRWEPGPGRFSGEWLFVPGGGGGRGLGPGLRLRRRHRPVALVVLDARHVAAGPVAEVHLPVRVPYGFHAAFVTA